MVDRPRVNVTVRLTPDELAVIDLKAKAEDRTRSQMIRRLLRTALAPAGDISAISTRDAQERASLIGDPAEALDLARRAQLTGDLTLTEAIVQRADLSGWNDVVDTILAEQEAAR